MKRTRIARRPPAKRTKTRLQPRNTKTKTIPLSKLKKQLEALQKQVVILKYGQMCFTCGRGHLGKKNKQLGHIPWPRAMLSTPCKYDHRYTRIQCFRCNIWLGGLGAVAYKKMQQEGKNLEEMWKLNEETKGKTVPRSWFETKMEEYKKMLK